MFEIQNLHNKKYISLETYRKNGVSVRSPVWFVILDNKIHVITREYTGKIKRLKHNKSVKIALCTFNGKLTGEVISATVSFVSPEKSKDAIKLRKQKYGFMEKIARFVSRKKGNLIVFSIDTRDSKRILS